MDVESNGASSKSYVYLTRKRLCLAEKWLMPLVLVILTVQHLLLLKYTMDTQERNAATDEMVLELKQIRVMMQERWNSKPKQDWLQMSESVFTHMDSEVDVDVGE